MTDHIYTDEEIDALVGEAEHREHLYYCNKCQYFGQASAHDCNYQACESRDSQNLDRAASIIRQLRARVKELEASDPAQSMKEAMLARITKLLTTAQVGGLRDIIIRELKAVDAEESK